MRFDWNATKASPNVGKHRVSVEEACTLFADSSVLSIPDEEHSVYEQRWISLGLSSAGRLLVVVHTWPEPSTDGDEVMRIISARRATARERRVYLERKA